MVAQETPERFACEAVLTGAQAGTGTDLPGIDCPVSSRGHCSERSGTTEDVQDWEDAFKGGCLHNFQMSRSTTCCDCYYV